MFGQEVYHVYLLYLGAIPKGILSRVVITLFVMLMRGSGCTPLGSVPPYIGFQGRPRQLRNRAGDQSGYHFGLYILTTLCE